MKKRRFVLLLLCFCLILPFMVSCKDDDDDDDSGFIYDYDDSSREKAKDSVPEGYDLDGESVGIYYASYIEKTVIGGGNNIEDDRHIVYSKIYERNSTVEARLNAELNFIPSQTPDRVKISGELKNYFQTADGTIDIVMSTNNTIVQKNLSNYFWSINDSYYIDLDEDWWYKDAIMETSVDGYEMRLLYGDININVYGNAGTIFYNKDLYEQYLANGKGRDYLYQVVLDGKWTLDYYYQLTRKSHIELGEEGTHDDIMGFLLTRHGGPMVPLSVSCGIDYYKRDEATGLPVVNFMDGVNQSKSLDVFDRMYKLVHENPGCDAHLLGNIGAEEGFQRSFTKGNYIFSMGNLIEAMNDDMRDMQSDYGILPYPKYDEAQTEYRSFMSNGTVLVGIPRTVSEDRMLDEISAVVECLASESYRHVSVAFFETALKGVYSRNDMDSQMIDIIMAQHETIPSILTKNFLYEYSESLNDIGTIFRDLVRDRSKNFQSTYDGKITSVQSRIRKLFQDYQDGIV